MRIGKRSLTQKPEKGTDREKVHLLEEELLEEEEEEEEEGRRRRRKKKKKRKKKKTKKTTQSVGPPGAVLGGLWRLFGRSWSV